MVNESWLVEALQGHVRMPVPADALLLAEEHRVDGLLGSRLLASGRLPRDLRARWRAHLLALAAADTVRHAELSALCGDIRSAGLMPLLMKGAGLAYTDYAATWQRPHDDVDIWCQANEAGRLQRVLERRGYAASGISRPAATGQTHFVRHDPSGAHHQVEVHSRMLTPAVFADALTFEEALQQARPVHPLGGMLTLGSTHALFLACLHRVAHHFRSPRLIWLHDIALMAKSFQQQQWDELRVLAERSATRAVVRANLEDVARVFGLAVPDAMIRALHTDVPEPSAAFLGSGVREIDVQWSNLRHASSWSAKRELIWNQIVPSADYMRARYEFGSPVLLPALYLWRLVSGAPRWLSRYSRRQP